MLPVTNGLLCQNFQPLRLLEHSAVVEITEISKESEDGGLMSKEALGDGTDFTSFSDVDFKLGCAINGGALSFSTMLFASQTQILFTF